MVCELKTCRLCGNKLDIRRVKLGLNLCKACICIHKEEIFGILDRLEEALKGGKVWLN